jgi:hypothetical protein
MRESIFQMQDHRSLTKLRRLIFISTSILAIPHRIDGVFQKMIPSLLAFFLFVTAISCSLELLMGFQISNKIRRSNADYRKMSWWIISGCSLAFFGFTAFTSLTTAPLKKLSVHLLTGKSAIGMPTYFERNNIEYFKHQKKSYG